MATVEEIEGGEVLSPLPSTHAAYPERRPLRRLVLLAAAGCLVLAGVAFLPALFGLGRSQDSRGALLYQASQNPLQVTVSAEGNVESASNLEVKCRVAGGSTILWIVEDGKIVEEGEEIVKLDTSAIEDKLNSQRIVYEKAQASEIQAREDVESAKISVREYEEGTFIEQLKQAEAGVQIAMENLRSSENQLKYSKRMVRKGFVSSLQREADEFAVERAKLDLDAANTRKKVLVDFTKEKTLKDLVAKREAAMARLRSEQAALQLEKARLDRLQDQLKNCVITAPTKGMVVYANDSRGGSRYSSRETAAVEEGALVREGQALVRLPDLSKMQVKVTIHESRVEQVRSGLPAAIVIQDQDYKGRVLNVANQPQPTSWMSANVKEYATTISIEGESTVLRPGMTARVTVLIDDLPQALTLPVSAVVEQKGSFFCWVKTDQGPQRRPLKLGRTNDKLIEVVDGVREGEEVYRNPRAVVEEARQEPSFETQAPDRKFLGAADAPGGAPGGAGALAGGTSPRTAAPGPEVPGAELAPAKHRATAASPDSGPPASPELSAQPRGGLEEPREGPSREPGKRSGRGGRGSFDLMKLDKDGDQKLAREELPPERAQQMLEMFDSNGDGSIDASEIAAMRQKRGAGGRQGPDRQGGEGRPDRQGRGDRPAREEGGESP